MFVEVPFEYVDKQTVETAKFWLFLWTISNDLPIRNDRRCERIVVPIPVTIEMFGDVANFTTWLSFKVIKHESSKGFDGQWLDLIWNKYKFLKIRNTVVF